MDDQPTQVGRLAFRIEGVWWRAYFAKPDTMDGAIMLGCIHMLCVKDNPETKESFMEAMKLAVADLLKMSTGSEIARWHSASAPEHERSGNA